MKTCTACGLTLSFDSFYAHPKTRDGYQAKCKPCVKQYMHDRRHGAGREAMLAYDKARSTTAKRQANARRYTAAWIAANPKERAAQNSVNNALRDGRLSKWPACSMPECGGKPVAHHPDYSRPLQVVWLCQAHHKQAHALTDKLNEVTANER